MEDNTCYVRYEDRIVDYGKFDVYVCGMCEENFAMFGMVKPNYCPKCGAKVVKYIMEPE